MGLLDDAIREHLDLKRRRGADPAEIERAEREALGPVRREPLAGEDPSMDMGQENGFESLEPPVLDLEGSGAGQAHEQYAVEPGRSPGQGEDFDDDYEDESDAEEEWDDYEEEDEGDLGHEAPEANRPAPPASPTAPRPAPAPAPEPEFDDDREADRPHGRPDAGTAEDFGDTVAYDIEPGRPETERPPSTPAGSEDDVLEETPDFLQDTPDHDRLWFEQKPPKDFDFDE